MCFAVHILSIFPKIVSVRYASQPYILCLTLGLNTHVSLELGQKDAKLNFKHENKLRVAGRGDHRQNPDNSDFAEWSGRPRPRAAPGPALGRRCPGPGPARPLGKIRIIWILPVVASASNAKFVFMLEIEFDIWDLLGNPFLKNRPSGQTQPQAVPSPQALRRAELARK